MTDKQDDVVDVSRDGVLVLNDGMVEFVPLGIPTLSFSF